MSCSELGLKECWLFDADTCKLNRNFKWKIISYVLLMILQIQNNFLFLFFVDLQLLLAFWQFPVSLPCQPLSFWVKLLMLFIQIPVKTSLSAWPACVPCWVESFYVVLLLMLLVSTSCRLQVKTEAKSAPESHLFFTESEYLMIWNKFLALAEKFSWNQ